MEKLGPVDHGEAVAIFRSEIIGALTRRDLSRGELRAELEEISRRRFRPPESKTTRSFSVATLERWFYAYKKGGLVALHPKGRSDRGRGRDLTPEQKKLLIDIRREHPSASSSLILRTLITDGRLEKGKLTASTIRRFYAEQGLSRIPLRDSAGSTTRLRWQAERPGLLWHGDVCHGPSITVDGVRRPLRIHALLDDASRFVVALEARHTERELDMLHVFVDALRRHGPPAALYLDNGATYRGDILRVACARLGITLVHARPYDPEARGKMERWWRTLREGCLDLIGGVASLHDVNVRLWAFLDQHYHVAPHAGLIGRSPRAVWQQGVQPADGSFDEDRLRDALTVRVKRRVRRDTTLSIEGHDFELDQGHLAGSVVVVAYCPIDNPIAPFVEHRGRRFDLYPVDAVKNRHRARPPRRPQESSGVEAGDVDFDPPKALLDRAAGRRPAFKKEKE